MAKLKTKAGAHIYVRFRSLIDGREVAFRSDGVVLKKSEGGPFKRHGKWDILTSIATLRTRAARKGWKEVRASRPMAEVAS